MATTYLNNTFSSPTNNYKWTLSVWVKRSGLGANQYIFQTYPSGQGYSRLYFDNTDKIQFDGEDTSQGNAFNLKTTRRFRDINAWYHIVLKWDVTQGTASNRVKIYVNGVEEGNYGTETYPAQNTTYPINRDKAHYIGRHSTDTNTYFEGLMSHIYFTDGYSYDASTFGSTDSTTGEWKINTSPSITMGTNGFTILKDGITITDQSSNSNDWTLAGGTLTKTEDCPSNVFNTYSNEYLRCNGTLSNANTTMAQSGSSWKMSFSNLGASSGKYYWETKYSGTYLKVGFVTDIGSVLNSSNNNYEHHADHEYGWAAYISGGNLEMRNDAAVISGYSTSDLSTSFSSGDILCLALDIDNGRFHFRKNDGSWLKSGDPVNNSGGLTIPFSDAKGNVAIPAISAYTATGNTNFGNGYFATTAVSSAGTNASGNGIFEYDVPTGYTAWSTKGLNL